MKATGFAIFYWLKIKASPGQKEDYTRSRILGDPLEDTKFKSHYTAPGFLTFSDGWWCYSWKWEANGAGLVPHF